MRMLSPLPCYFLLWKFQEQSPFLGLGCFKTMVKMKIFGSFSQCMNHNRTDAYIFGYSVTS